jgi:hypothetical protein
MRKLKIVAGIVVALIVIAVLGRLVIPRREQVSPADSGQA